MGIPRGNNNAPLVADLFHYVLREITFCLCPDVIEAFNSTSRYLNGLLNVDNPYFERRVS